MQEKNRQNWTLCKKKFKLIFSIYIKTIDISIKKLFKKSVNIALIRGVNADIYEHKTSFYDNQWNTVEPILTVTLFRRSPGLKGRCVTPPVKITLLYTSFQPSHVVCGQRSLKHIPNYKLGRVKWSPVSVAKRSDKILLIFKADARQR